MSAHPDTAALFSQPDLLERLGAGDSSAQRAVHASEYRSVRSVVERIVRSAPDAETIAADLFTDFFLARAGELRAAGAIPAYLRIMAVRRARRHLARTRREAPEIPHAAEQERAPVEEALDQARYARWLEDCLGTLTSRARSVLKLQYGHDLSYTEIGGHLGISKQAVGKMSLKTLAALRRCIEAHEAGGKP